MSILEKKTISNLILPSFLSNKKDFEISNKLKNQVKISFYHSISELNKMCKSTNFEIIILEDKIFNKWFLDNEHNAKEGFILIDTGNLEIFSLNEKKILDWIPKNNLSSELLNFKLEKSLVNLKLNRENENLKNHIFRQEKSFLELHDIGVNLSKEKNVDSLLNSIVSKSIHLTNADGGSLYLLETTPNTKDIDSDYFLNKQISLKVKKIISRKTNNDSKSLFKLSPNSICGNVILNGSPIIIDDLYQLSEEVYHPQEIIESDNENNYLTKSLLIVPLINSAKQVFGAIQLVNRKRNFNTILTNKHSIKKLVIPFEKQDLYFLETIASQAAIAFENTKLIKSVHILFDGFINASVRAIESRDPTTSGHSSRVATLTLGMAETVNQIKTGRFSSINFNADQLDEIRYASLLHDFGKIGVKERVLVKSKKLYPEEFQALQDRFHLIRTIMELELSKKQIIFFIEQSREKALSNLRKSKKILQEKLDELDDILKFFCRSNEPTILEHGELKKLMNLAQNTFEYPKGELKNYLNENEICSLSIQKGSLNEQDRKEIESHVTHTFNFLKIIPWSKNLKRVPEIAYAHHEKLNGKGYPRKLKGKEIPLETKMMTISDIYDALTAWDRPYKKALSPERALDILSFEAKDNYIDQDLLDIFIDHKLYSLVQRAT